MVGVGLAMFVEKAGLGPADGVRIQVDTTGEIEVITGGASIGQGFETVMAQVAAEMLGADMKKMRVIHGQTDRIEHGIGAHASRATVMTASATRVAALKVRDKALDIASELMQAPVDTLDIINGEVVVKGRAGGPSMTLGQIAAALGPSSKTRGDREPGLSAEGWFYADHQVYPYGNHLAVVKVDPDTGGVKVLRYVVGYDIGRAINPTLVKGQIAGGFAQGLGGALMEEFTYNERGDPLAVTFADYLLPTVRETPDLEIILREDYPTPLNPLGIKGAGESGVNAVGAAIASAIDDAIGIPGAITQLPVTPQRLKAIIDGEDVTENWHGAISVADRDLPDATVLIAAACGAVAGVLQVLRSGCQGREVQPGPPVPLAPGARVAPGTALRAGLSGCAGRRLRRPVLRGSWRCRRGPAGPGGPEAGRPGLPSKQPAERDRGQKQNCDRASHRITSDRSCVIADHRLRPRRPAGDCQNVAFPQSLDYTGLIMTSRLRHEHQRRSARALRRNPTRRSRTCAPGSRRWRRPAR